MFRVQIPRAEQEAVLAMLRVAGDCRGLSQLCQVGRPLRQRQRQTGREGHMTLSQQGKTLSIRVLHFPDRMTGRLQANVSYEKPCYARQSLNILVDGVADGAGEAARRRPKSFFHDFRVMTVRMNRQRPSYRKRSRICSLYSLS